MVRYFRFADFWRMCDRWADRERKLAAKSALAANGFLWRLSVYGKLRHAPDGSSRFRRAEILAFRPFSAAEVELLHRYFHSCPPDGEYNIYAFLNGKLRLFE